MGVTLVIHLLCMPDSAADKLTPSLLTLITRYISKFFCGKICVVYFHLATQLQRNVRYAICNVPGPFLRLTLQDLNLKMKVQFVALLLFVNNVAQICKMCVSAQKSHTTAARGSCHLGAGYRKTRAQKCNIKRRQTQKFLFNKKKRAAWTPGLCPEPVAIT